MGQGPGGWEKNCDVVVRPGRDAAGGVRARHTSTRQGSKHPTRKQAPDKETNTRQGHEHPTRKQTPNKEASTRQGSKHSTRKHALISHYVLLYSLASHMLDPYFPLFPNMFQMLDHDVLHTCSYILPQFSYNIYIYIHRLQSYSDMPRILNAIIYPSLIPGPYPD